MGAEEWCFGLIASTMFLQYNVYGHITLNQRMSIGGFHFQSAELHFNHHDFQCKTVAINFYPREINVVDKNALSEQYFGQEVLSCFDYLIRIQACNNCPPLLKTLKFGLKHVVSIIHDIILIFIFTDWLQLKTSIILC